jgi:ribosome biogenesis GTPase / thiamine phosphate phosphatase
MPRDLVVGWVVRTQSGFYDVQTGEGNFICRLRGRLKKVRLMEDLVAVGDRVKITALSDGSGAIEEIMPRQRALVRLDPRPRGDYQQILLANVDQILLAFACAQPEPHLRMLDRFLVIAEKQAIPPLIIANKVDLVGLEKAREMFSIYPDLGYPVLFTSACRGDGVHELQERLKGKISGITGPSGVGKSSLLNACNTQLDLNVNTINQITQRGRHTTVVREMFPVEDGGYVADLPGLRSLALWDTEPEELDGYFPELRSLVMHCQFNDCTHTSEPGCAVLEAVKTGKVHAQRYESYLRLRYGEDSNDQGTPSNLGKDNSEIA